jgi:hypothetical protein
MDQPGPRSRLNSAYPIPAFPVIRSAWPPALVHDRLPGKPARPGDIAAKPELPGPPGDGRNASLRRKASSGPRRGRATGRAAKGPAGTPQPSEFCLSNSSVSCHQARPASCPPGHDRLPGEPARPGDRQQHPDDDGRAEAPGAEGEGTRAMALIYLSADIQMLTWRKEIK